MVPQPPPPRSLPLPLPRSVPVPANVIPFPGTGSAASIPEPVRQPPAPAAVAPRPQLPKPALAPIFASAPAPAVARIVAPSPVAPSPVARVPVAAPAPAAISAQAVARLPSSPLAMPLLAPASAAPDVATPASRWAIFEQLGLGPKAEIKQNTAKLLVSIYRAMGFAILSIIVVVLVGYIATSAFYFVSDSWIQPMVVSRSDEKVLALQAQVAEHENERDRINAELNQADRYIAVQQMFQAEFADAIRADLTGRKAALSRAREMAEHYAGARTKIQRSNQAYASASRKRMSQEYAAGLIDRGDMLSGKFQLAQISSSNLSLAERQSEYETRAEDLEAEAGALDAILSEKGGEGALSYDVLRIKQEYEMSRLEATKAIENREALKASLTRQEAILDGLRQSPYLRAIADDAVVAFVPYGNLDNVSAGAPLYKCRLEMLFCSKVGKVIEILPGEINFKHPQREKVLRGQLVEIDLEDGNAGEEDVLFVGGRPLFI